MRDEARRRAEAARVPPPACEIDLPVEQTVPFVFNSPHSGRYYPRDFLAATCLDKSEIRRSEDLLVDRLFAPIVRARRAADERRLSARLSRREPRALRARPEDVRRAAPELRQCALAARRRRARHHPARRQRRRPISTRGRCRSRRGLRGSSASTAPITTRCGACSRRRMSPSASPSSSTATRCRRTSAADRRGCGPDFVLGDRFGASCMPELTDCAAATLQQPRLHRLPQQALCRRLHHRALRPAGARPACAADRGQSRALHGRVPA